MHISRKNPMGPTIQNRRPTLVYNNIFAVLMILYGVVLLVCSTTILSAGDTTESLVCVTPIFCGAFLIFTGVALIMNKAIGYKCAMITVVLHIGLSAILNIIGVMGIYYGATNEGEVAALYAIYGIYLLLIYVPTFIFYALSWIYYIKCRDFFTFGVL